MQFDQRGSLQRQHQNAASFLVEAVRQFEKAGIRQFHAQLLDDAQTDAAAAMHSLAGGFVDHQ